jgi:hypothetical protein
MARLYGCAERLTAENGGFRPGQTAQQRRLQERKATRKASGGKKKGSKRARQ